MNHTLSDIKRLRRNLGITQTELANAASVSQSMIAKIESGILDPGFSKAQKIFDTLDVISSKNTKKASDIMISKVISVTPSTSVSSIIKILNKYSVSQVPVISKGVVVGIVTESGLLKALTDNRKIVDDIMDETPPTVSRDTSLKIIIEILKSYPVVLVMEKGLLKGIITKSDLLMKI
jgi:predicted transcriptional regulator